MTTTLPRRVLREVGTAPDPERLLRAVELVVERLQPDQLILHGSAARGELTEWSDIDFIAVRADAIPRGEAPNRRRDTELHRWTCEGTDDVVHVLVADRERIESKRRMNGTVYAAALLEGRTVFVKQGVEPVRTAAEREEDGPVTALKRQTFSRTEAAKYISQARVRPDRSRSARPDRRLHEPHADPAVSRLPAAQAEALDLMREWADFLTRED